MLRDEITQIRGMIKAEIAEAMNVLREEMKAQLIKPKPEFKEKESVTASGKEK